MPTFRARTLRRYHALHRWLIAYWTPPLHLTLGITLILAIWPQIWLTDWTRAARYVAPLPLPPRDFLTIFEVALVILLLLPSGLVCRGRFGKCRSEVALAHDVAAFVTCAYIVILVGLLGAFQVAVRVAPTGWTIVPVFFYLGASVLLEMGDRQGSRAGVPMSATLSTEWLTGDRPLPPATTNLPSAGEGITVGDA
jgi:hypothetical protein